MDLKKKFLEYRTDENGVVSLWTTTSEDDVMRNMYIKLQMYRRIVRDDTEPGSANPNVVVPWDTYGYPFLVGYDKNGQEDIRKDARNPFDVEDAEGTWAYRIPNVGQNQGLPRRGLYKDSNGNYIQVRYQYLFKEIDVLDGGFNSIGGEWAAWLPYLWEAKDKHANKEVQVFELQTAQDQDRILNVPGASLTIQKDWVGGHSDIEEIYIKVYRRTEGSSGGWTDFTDVICKEMNLGAISQNYVEDASTSLDTTNKWLVLKQSNNWKVTIHHVPILNSKDSGRRFEYKIVEVGYKDINHPNKIYTEEETGAAFSPTYYEWSISANDFVEQTTGQGFILKYKHDLYNKLMVRNSRPYGSLQIIKRVMPLGKESEADNVDFVFDVTLNLPAEKTLASSDLSIAEEYGTISDFSRTDQTVTFKVTIKGANTVTIDGIPYGTTYTVVEETPPSGWAKVGSEEYSDASTKTVSATDDPIDWVRATNTEITEVKVDKTWFQTNGTTSLNDSIQNASITVELRNSENQTVTDANGTALSDSARIITLNGSEDPKWEYTWSNLPKHYERGDEIEYQVVETSAVVNGEQLLVSGTEKTAEQDEVNQNCFHLTNTLPTTTIDVEKKWPTGQTGLPDGTTVTFEISATVPGAQENQTQAPNGVTISPDSVTLDGITDSNPGETEAWKFTWANLPKYDNNGKLITYTVTETAYQINNVDAVSTPLPEGDRKLTANGYKFTFTNDLPKTERHAEKVWVDDNDKEKLRLTDSITFILKATYDDAGTEIPVNLSDYGITAEQTITPNDNGVWSTADWDNLPVYTHTGETISYEIEEVSVTNYTSLVSYDDENKTWTVTNKLGITSVSLSGTKTMKGGETPDNDFYSFVLSATEGTPMPLGATTENGVTSLTVKNSNDVDIDFKTIIYKLSDMIGATAVDGQVGKTEKTFTYTIREVDENSSHPLINYDPAEYTVTVRVEYDSTTGNMTHDAPVYSKNVGGTPSSPSSIIFENEELTEVGITKEWSSSAGKNAPENIEIQLTLYKGEEATDQVSVITLNGTPDDNPVNPDAYEDIAWHALWKNLPKYENGSEILYVVKETPELSGYTVKYSADGTASYVSNGETITNELNETDLKIVKVNADGMTQPLTGAIFTLTKIDANGDAIGSSTTIDMTSKSEETVHNLIDGTYRLEETKVPAGFIGMNGSIIFTIEGGTVNSPNLTDITTIRYAPKDNETPATITVGNTAGTELPSTGGSGTLIYTITGIFLIALAGVILVSRKKRKV